ncbi:hypothetical protein A2U01_0092702, partial [Trifolium medium]|nr:hypothetical protein [Trifolium medium]
MVCGLFLNPFPSSCTEASLSLSFMVTMSMHVFLLLFPQ